MFPRSCHAISVLAPVFLLLNACTVVPGVEESIGATILGDHPRYGPQLPSPIPNSTAITARIWVPELDAGYDPQGLAIAAGGSLFISGYLSDSWQRHNGTCRVLRVSPGTGNETGHFDIPAPCGHAGGIAYADDGTIFISDTHTLFECSPVFGSEPRVRQFPLDPELTGAFITADHTSIWIGTYDPDGPGRLFRFEFQSLHRLDNGQTLTRAMAAREIEIPSYAQGAAIEPDGRRIWLSRSGIDWATLDVIDVSSGTRLHRYPAPAGLEGIAFDPTGTLWSISEAGTRHFYDYPLLGLFIPFNPLIMAIDVTALR